MNRYEYADGLLAVLSLVAWLGMAVGVAASIYLGFTTENLWLLIGIVTPTVVSGLTVLALVQIGHAVLDLATNSAATAEWARHQLQEERQRQKAAQGQVHPSTLYSVPKPNTARPASSENG